MESLLKAYSFRPTGMCPGPFLRNAPALAGSNLGVPLQQLKPSSTTQGASFLLTGFPETDLLLRLLNQIHFVASGAHLPIPSNSVISIGEQKAKYKTRITTR